MQVKMKLFLRKYSKSCHKIQKHGAAIASLSLYKENNVEKIYSKNGIDYMENQLSLVDNFLLVPI